MPECNKNFSSLARQRITIEALTLIDDTYGGNTQTWSIAHVVWAIVEEKSGKEVIKGDQRESSINLIATIRYISNLSNTQDGAKYRVKFNGKYFNIISVQNTQELPSATYSRYSQTSGKGYQILICEQAKGATA